ncbi:MAG: 4'-phosphopantetheinyl transferase superfamily protein [Lysobacteraceae bacterium]
MGVLLGVNDIDAVLERLPSTETWLGSDERARLAAMTHPLRRAQFLAGHGYARELLAEMEGGRAGDWTLERNAHGAPLALRRGRPTGLHLSLAHSGGQLAAAVAAVPVGVDIERALRQRDLLGLASALYAPAFVQVLAAEDDLARRQRFFQRWTLDEARAKALGTGLQPKALREHGWDRAADVAADGWTWNLADGWLALSLPECERGRILTHWSGPAPEAAAFGWRWSGGVLVPE